MSTERWNLKEAGGKLLDDLDKELTKRGLEVVRYADDFHIFVASKRVGERVMKSITHFVEEKLKLKVNRDKSAVDRPWNRKFPRRRSPGLRRKSENLRIAPGPYRWKSVIHE
nr:reverse transcriptase domain-containing protein [Paenibacillus lautus]